MQRLADHCACEIESGRTNADIASVVIGLAGAAIEIAHRIALGPFDGAISESAGRRNTDGDVQKQLDLRCHEIVVGALRTCPVAAVLSEEAEQVEVFDSAAPLAVAVDPLDGSSNIDVNLSIGTIFSVLPAQNIETTPLGAFGGPGHRQLAAGFFVYGPQTTLVLTLGHGVDIFTLDPRDRVFRLTKPETKIPLGVREYAINASNYRHWYAPVRTYIDDCLNGSSGLRGADFNMRWTASLVAEAFRILTRGGIFLYPADARPGYENGRLRLLYEAAPIAFIVEQAGGMASTGRTRILDVVPNSLHQRIPLIFGAADKVNRLNRLHQEPHADADRSPLFGHRGLFRS